MELRSEFRQDGGHGIIAGLIRIASAGDDHADLVVVENPTLSHLNHGEPFRYENLHLVSEFHALVKWDAGEGFSYVESGAIAIEIAVVVRGKFRFFGELPGEQAAGERESHDDAHALFFGDGEKLGDGLLAEDVEDNLQAGEVRLLQADESFLHRLDARAVVFDFALFLESAEPGEYFTLFEHLDGEAMKLNQINRLDVEALERGLQGRAHTFLRILVRVEVIGTTELGRDEGLYGMGLQELADQLFAAARAVNVGGIEKGYAAIRRRLQNLKGLRLLQIAPIASAELPTTKSYFGNFRPRLPKRSIFHKNCLRIIHESGHGSRLNLAPEVAFKRRLSDNRVMRPLFLLVWFLVLSSGISYAKDSSEQILTTAYFLPSFIFAEKEKLADGTIKWTSALPSIKTWNGEEFFEDAFDARSILESQGIDFSANSSAIYFPARQTIIVKNTAKNLEILGMLFEPGCRLEPLLLQTELILVSFRSSERNIEKDIPSYNYLRNAAGESWKEIARLEILSKSGAMAIGRALSANMELTGGQKLPDSAEGCIAEVEVVVGPDGETLGSRISFQFRGAVAGNSEPLNITFDGDTSHWTGKPQILQFYRSGSSEISYALILRTTVSWPDRKPVNSKVSS